MDLLGLTLHESNASLAACMIESFLVPAVSSTVNLRGKVAMTTVTNVCVRHNESLLT